MHRRHRTGVRLDCARAVTVDRGNIAPFAAALRCPYPAPRRRAPRARQSKDNRHG